MVTFLAFELTFVVMSVRTLLLQCGQGTKIESRPCEIAIHTSDGSGKIKLEILGRLLLNSTEFGCNILKKSEWIAKFKKLVRF